MNLLTSRDNPLIKTTLSLQKRKGREKKRLFLAEGPHLLEEALKSSFTVRWVLIKEGITPSGRWWDLLAKSKIPIYQVASRLYTALTETQTPQDVLGVVAYPPETAGFPLVDPDFCGIILHELQDPGNLGTIIRTVWAAGIKTLFTTPGTVDPYGGKVVRASQGGIFNLQLLVRPLDTILVWAKQQGIKVWGADPRGTKLYYEEDLTGPTLFLLGNEAHGFDRTKLDRGRAVEGIRIPLPGGAESLNVSIAAAILIYEALRQRG
ncbi:MAG TPA: RNA methyltransferase [Firmicutes bacterium]|nr:RNA methyltransferase [Bacillota bacterium]